MYTINNNSGDWPRAYYVNLLSCIMSFNFHIIPLKYYSPFTDKQTEAQRGQLSHVYKANNWWSLHWYQDGFKPKLAAWYTSCRMLCALNWKYGSIKFKVFKSDVKYFTDVTSTHVMTSLWLVLLPVMLCSHWHRQLGTPLRQDQALHFAIWLFWISELGQVDAVFHENLSYRWNTMQP